MPRIKIVHFQFEEFDTFAKMCEISLENSSIELLLDIGKLDLNDGLFFWNEGLFHVFL